MPIEQLFLKQKKIESYIKDDSELARKLYNAGGDLETIKNEIKKKSLDPFIENIMDAPQYNSFVRSVSDNIIERHQEIVEEEKLKQMGLKKKPLKRKLTYKDYDKQYRATVVPRIDKKRVRAWNSTEEVFLRARTTKGLSTKEIVDEYYNFFGVIRSTSSVKSKVRRMK